MISFITFHNMMSFTCSCMPNCFYFALWSRLARRSIQSSKEWSFFRSFSCLLLFPKFKGQVKEDLLFILHEMVRVSHAVACPMGFNVLFEQGAGRTAQTYKKRSFSGIFSRLSCFSQVFWQVKDWDILKQHEIIRVSHLLVCSIAFTLLCRLSWQRDVLKLTEKFNFKYF